MNYLRKLYHCGLFTRTAHNTHVPRYVDHTEGVEMDCPSCGGVMEHTEVRIHGYYVGAFVCEGCGYREVDRT